MKRTIKKFTLHRETLCALSDLRLVVGAVNTDRTECATGCVTNCAACNISVAGTLCPSAGTHCC
jgi:hypothetical protein